MVLRLTILFSAAWLSLADGATAQKASKAPSTSASQLSGLSSTEADALIKNLQSLQRRLRSGESLFFELLSGAPASYAMAAVSPREAFLQLPLDRTFSIERVRTDNQLWQPYKLTVMPNGLGHMFWDVEVVLGVNGDVERVTMLYRPPAPA
jgi:hypothetical protein